MSRNRKVILTLILIIAVSFGSFLILQKNLNLNEKKTQISDSQIPALEVGRQVNSEAARKALDLSDADGRSPAELIVPELGDVSRYLAPQLANTFSDLGELSSIEMSRRFYDHTLMQKKTKVNFPEEFHLLN
jgi:hypothetical protein